MKQRDIQKCICCGQGVAHGGQLTFTRLKVERMFLNQDAIRRQHGLEMMMGDAAFLAAHMGPDEDLATVVHADTVFVCNPCGLRSLWEIIEAVGERAGHLEPKEKGSAGTK